MSLIDLSISNNNNKKTIRCVKSEVLMNSKKKNWFDTGLDLTQGVELWWWYRHVAHNLKEITQVGVPLSENILFRILDASTLVSSYPDINLLIVLNLIKFQCGKMDFLVSDFLVSISLEIAKCWSYFQNPIFGLVLAIIDYSEERKSMSFSVNFNDTWCRC